MEEAQKTRSTFLLRVRHRREDVPKVWKQVQLHLSPQTEAQEWSLPHDEIQRKAGDSPNQLSVGLELAPVKVFIRKIPPRACRYGEKEKKSRETESAGSLMRCKVPALDYLEAVLALPVLPQSDTAGDLHMQQLKSHPAAAITLTPGFQCVQRVLPHTPAVTLQPGMGSACPAPSRSIILSSLPPISWLLKIDCGDPRMEFCSKSRSCLLCCSISDHAGFWHYTPLLQLPTDNALPSLPSASAEPRLQLAGPRQSRQSPDKGPRVPAAERREAKGPLPGARPRAALTPQHPPVLRLLPADPLAAGTAQRSRGRSGPGPATTLRRAPAPAASPRTARRSRSRLPGARTAAPSRSHRERSSAGPFPSHPAAATAPSGVRPRTRSSPVTEQEQEPPREEEEEKAAAAGRHRLAAPHAGSAQRRDMAAHLRRR